jgi:hypothetical protein
MIACLTFVFSAIAAISAAEDFRIQTNVYAGNNTTPVSKSLTLFRAGYVYDYLEGDDPAMDDRIAIFDKAHGRFIVLDPARKVRAEVKTDDVLLFAGKLQAAVATHSTHEFTRFAADPQFEVDFQPDGTLKLTSDVMTYKLTTMPARSPEAAAQFREFSDWYARFNTMAHPGSTPPFARMAVNAELAKQGVVPTEVHLSIPAQSGMKAAELRSEHHVTWYLLPKDSKRIDATSDQLATFKEVHFDELQRQQTAKK